MGKFVKRLLNYVENSARILPYLTLGMNEGSYGDVRPHIRKVMSL